MIIRTLLHRILHNFFLSFWSNLLIDLIFYIMKTLGFFHFFITWENLLNVFKIPVEVSKKKNDVWWWISMCASFVVGNNASCFPYRFPSKHCLSLGLISSILVDLKKFIFYDKIYIYKCSISWCIKQTNFV